MHNVFLLSWTWNRVLRTCSEIWQCCLQSLSGLLCSVHRISIQLPSCLNSFLDPMGRWVSVQRALHSPTSRILKYVSVVQCPRAEISDPFAVMSGDTRPSRVQCFGSHRPVIQGTGNPCGYRTKFNTTLVTIHLPVSAFRFLNYANHQHTRFPHQPTHTQFV